MLNAVKHLYRSSKPVNWITITVEMLHCVQHDVQQDVLLKTNAIRSVQAYSFSDTCPEICLAVRRAWNSAWAERMLSLSSSEKVGRSCS